MELTLAQKQTLKAAILADPVLAAKTSGPGTDYGFIADALNKDAAPAFWGYKALLGKHELTDQTSPDGTTFAWGGTTGGFINRSQGERDCWREIWNTSLSCNPSRANVRAAFDDIFSGAGAGAVNNRAHIAAMIRRKATVVEKLFATGTGSTASPGTFAVEGSVDLSDIAGLFNV